jgi:hypothetical protein
MPDCFVCFFDAKLDPTRLMYPVKGYCPHSRFFKSSKPHYKIVKPILLFFVAFGSTGLVLLMFHFTYFATICQSDKPSCLIFIADETFIAGTVLMLYVIFLSTKSSVPGTQPVDRHVPKTAIVQFPNQQKDCEEFCSRKKPGYRSDFCWNQFCSYLSSCVYYGCPPVVLLSEDDDCGVLYH